MTATQDAIAWIDARYAAGAKRIGVTCQPERLLIYLTADAEHTTIRGATWHDTRIARDIIHDYIAQLPPRTPGDFVPGTDNVGGTYTPRKRKR